MHAFEVSRSGRRWRVLLASADASSAAGGHRGVECSSFAPHRGSYFPARQN
jgi:hypothetical protein